MHQRPANRDGQHNSTLVCKRQTKKGNGFQSKFDKDLSKFWHYVLIDEAHRFTAATNSSEK